MTALTMSAQAWLYHGIQAAIVIAGVTAVAWSVRVWRAIDRLEREDDERARASRSPGGTHDAR